MTGRQRAVYPRSSKGRRGHVPSREEMLVGAGEMRKSWGGYREGVQLFAAGHRKKIWSGARGELEGSWAVSNRVVCTGGLNGMPQPAGREGWRAGVGKSERPISRTEGWGKEGRRKEGERRRKMKTLLRRRTGTFAVA